MKLAAAITGIGLVTPLGRSVQSTWDALLQGRCITGHFRLESCDGISIPRVNSLAVEAAGQALAQANWNEPVNQTAVICCTSKGAVESWISPGSIAMQDQEPEFGLAGLSICVANHFGLTEGPPLTVSAACASGLHGLIRAAMMIHGGEARRVLVVAAEASVHPLFVGSFQRLGVLVPPGELCRPFDLHRRGFLMSDAAAAVCVQAINPSDPPEHFAVIEHFAMGGDATHLTGSDPSGQLLQRMLQQTIGEQSVDLIHAHGTGTAINDAMEITAMEKIFAGGVPPNLYSHKAALGHSLGASGLMSVAINCMCHRTGTVPPNVNTVEPMETVRLRISRVIERRDIRRSLIHAAGFGGPAGVVVLSGADHASV